MTSAEEIGDGVRRLTAPNPGPMTHTGTQTYLVGTDDVAVIDPGPDLEAHRAAILAAGGGGISHVIVTHAHLDHSAGAVALARATGAPIVGFGPAEAGRSAQMADLAGRLEIAGGEGVDAGFSPDIELGDGGAVAGADWRIEAVHTPGHMSNHLCLAAAGTGVLFSGDTVMGWSSTLISPPDGSLTDFMTSLDRLSARDEVRYLPGHGPEVADGKGAVAGLRAHRLGREAQIVAALEAGASTVEALVAQIYHEVPRALHRAAARNVLAHLLDLQARGRARLSGDDPLGGGWRLE